jgi:F-type H+-transporting ATPase subunit b
MMTRVLALLLTLLPLAARADEIPEGAHAVGIPWNKLAFATVNVGIFLYILRRALWPVVRNYLIERRDAVRTALEKADRARREAEALRVEWQHRLDKLGAELEEMLTQARADIERERDEILAAARRTAETIQRDAERTAENELRQARELLRAEVARQALAIAERVAPERLTGADQARFVDEFVGGVTR